jgi:hypothetical protein
LPSSNVGRIVDSSDVEKVVGDKVGKAAASEGPLSEFCPLGPFPPLGLLLVLIPFPLPFPLTDLLFFVLAFGDFPTLGFLSVPVGAGVLTGGTVSLGLGAKEGISELVIVG